MVPSSPISGDETIPPHGDLLQRTGDTLPRVSSCKQISIIQTVMTKAHLSAIVAILSLGSSPVVAQKKAGNASQGKVVFGRCSGCHSADTPDRKGGPSLKGLFKRSKL